MRLSTTCAVMLETFYQQGTQKAEQNIASLPTDLVCVLPIISCFWVSFSCAQAEALANACDCVSHTNNHANHVSLEMPVSSSGQTKSDAVVGEVGGKERRTLNMHSTCHFFSLGEQILVGVGWKKKEDNKKSPDLASVFAVWQSLAGVNSADES